MDRIRTTNYLLALAALTLGWLLLSRGKDATPAVSEATLPPEQTEAAALPIPASTTEKWISLFLVTCVAAPVVLGVLLLASDGLMSLLFPNSYGTRVLDMTKINEVLDMAKEEGIYINAAGLTVIDWMMNILTFTLGAICFKKAKVAKTLLCVFALGMVLSTLLAILLGSGNLDASWFMDRFSTPAQAATAINWYLNITCFGTLALLLGGIFYRLRTIQH